MTLDRRDAPLAVEPWDQAHGNDAAQDRGQLDAHLALLERREDRDDAVDRFRGIDRVQGGEHQVPGLGGRQGRLDGFVVAHLADQDHVRILAQGRFQGGLEALGVGADLALVDDAFLVAMQKLDRVLDGDDMRLAVGVDVVDHRGKGG